MGEWAIDVGGPRREFFRLFADKAQENMLIGTSALKFFKCDMTALQVRTIMCIIVEIITILVEKRLLHSWVPRRHVYCTKWKWISIFS